MNFNIKDSKLTNSTRTIFRLLCHELFLELPQISLNA